MLKVYRLHPIDYMKRRFLHGLTLRQLIKELVASVMQDDVTDLAAQMGYWALLSIFPFAIFVLTVIGYLPIHGLADQMLDLLHRLMPADAAKLFDSVIHDVVRQQHGWLLVIALVAGLWSASAGVSGTITALNRAQGVAETRPWWKVKLLALGMTVIAALLIIIATAALIIGPEVGHTLWSWFGLGNVFDFVWRILRWPVIIAAMMLMLAFFYWALPDVRRPFRFISPGAVMAVLLWLGASSLFSLYASHLGSYSTSYGTLGAAVVLLTWLYLAALAVIFGGELNAVLDRAAERTLKREQQAQAQAPAQAQPESQSKPPQGTPRFGGPAPPQPAR